MLPPHSRTPFRPTSSSSSSNQTHPDDAIRQTDDDAASSRASATNIGYLDDPFVGLLYRPPMGQAGTGRKPPLINVGTHHRTVGIDTIVDRFLASGQISSSGVNGDGRGHDGDGDGGGGGGLQIVSLGAGSDTRFWRLMSRPAPPHIAKYVEIDFPHLTSPKAQRIARSKKLHSLLSPSLDAPTHTAVPAVPGAEETDRTSSALYKVSQGGTRLDSQLYTLLPLDLRPSSSASDATSISGILDAHLLPLLDPSRPTLFLAECLFPYMAPGESEAIIAWFGQRFDECTGVVYEMCGLDDGFGKVMKRNLASRNLSIPGSTFPTPQSQADRFLDPGLGAGAFQHAGAKTLWQVREDVIPSVELNRISKLEILDEIEELKLVLEHYVIAWGTKGRHMAGVAL